MGLLLYVRLRHEYIRRRHGVLGKTIVSGKVDGSRKTGGPNTKWHRLEFARGLEDTAFWRSIVDRVAGKSEMT